ncbi:Dual specificity phosphatase [Macleaya cordata]|uniref:phosphatidylglycerophosphatase n=1 Tax=Macleaya cordata TaxID=56857 RepID=A0A200QSN8_MACCD|nr:Dual specificity phosphatase [Macleaya cordata]
MGLLWTCPMSTFPDEGKSTLKMWVLEFPLKSVVGCRRFLFLKVFRCGRRPRNERRRVVQGAGQRPRCQSLCKQDDDGVNLSLSAKQDGFDPFLKETSWLLEADDGEIEIPDSYSDSESDFHAKRALVGAVARILFYPTLMYNVARNKIEPEFHWWDEIDPFILLGAVPFASHVPCLKELGVHGVVTLNEAYETLVPTSLYHAHGIDHLIIPTRDYLYAPPYENICKAVHFIHKNASSGKKTYVHCKAGRGRSTTIVLCYLVQYKLMTPDAAYEHVKSIRPRVNLATSQRQAVIDFYANCFKNKDSKSIVSSPAAEDPEATAMGDASIMVVTESDLDGYDGDNEISKISGPWLKKKKFGKRIGRKKQDNCSEGADHLGGLGADIRVH